MICSCVREVIWFADKYISRRQCEEAFGESWGLLAGYLGWISGVTNNASYPVLFLSYVHKQFFPHMTATDHNIFLRYGILFGITLVLAFVNYRGLDVVGKASVLIFFVSIAPFVLMVCIGIPKGKYIGAGTISLAYHCA